jgi:hypothetical protein
MTHTILLIYVSFTLIALVFVFASKMTEPKIPPEVMKVRFGHRIARKHHVPNRLSPETSGTVYMIVQDVDELTIDLIGRKYHLNQVTGEWSWFDMDVGELLNRRRYECPLSYAEKYLQSRPWSDCGSLLVSFLKNPRREFQAIIEARKQGWSGQCRHHAYGWLKADERTRKLIYEW